MADDDEFGRPVCKLCMLAVGNQKIISVGENAVARTKLVSGIPLSFPSSFTLYESSSVASVRTSGIKSCQDTMQNLQKGCFAVATLNQDKKKKIIDIVITLPKEALK